MQASRALVPFMLWLAGCAMAGNEADSGTQKPPIVPAPDARPAAVDAGRPDALPVASDAAPPDACVPTTVQLLGNPGFESGHTVWTELADPKKSPESLIMSAAQLSNHGTVPPQAGSYAVWMGGLSPINEQLSQLVAIPADATALRFKGYVWVGSVDLETIVLDRLTIEIAYPGGKDVVNGWDNTTRKTAWTPFDIALPRSYAGQTISLMLHAVNDDSFQTNFFFDTLELDATVCR